MDLQVSLRPTKSQAQRLIKHLYGQKFIFTSDDLKRQGVAFKGKKREKPLKYYLTEMKARIIGDNKNNAQIDTRGLAYLNSIKYRHSASCFRNSLQHVLIAIYTRSR